MQSGDDLQLTFMKLEGWSTILSRLMQPPPTLCAISLSKAKTVTQLRYELTSENEALFTIFTVRIVYKIIFNNFSNTDLMHFVFYLHGCLGVTKLEG